MERPDSAECAAYYFLYIDQVPNGDPLELLVHQLEHSPRYFRGLPSPMLDRRYAPGKWSVKEILGHLIDTERAFAYRAFSFARREPAALHSFEQDPYVVHSRYGSRDLDGILDEYATVRAASLALFRSFDDEEWMRRGIASGCEFTVRTIPWILAGHEVHHRQVIEDRYRTT